MTDGNRRKAMIRQRMAQTGASWREASRKIGAWWAENMPGQGPKREYYEGGGKK